MVYMMAQTHYLMAVQSPSLVFKYSEFIVAMSKLGLQIASVASMEVLKEDVRYNIAELLLLEYGKVAHFFFFIKKLLLISVKFKEILLSSLMCIPLLCYHDVARQTELTCNCKTELFYFFFTTGQVRISLLTCNKITNKILFSG